MLCVASTLRMLTGSLALGGCVLAGAAIGDVATVAIGAGVGAVTGSPALGLAAGVAASMGIKYAERSRTVKHPLFGLLMILLLSRIAGCRGCGAADATAGSIISSRPCVAAR